MSDNSSSQEDKKMKIEEIPETLLTRIGEFLSYTERKYMSRTSPTLWKANKKIHADLTPFGFDYPNLLRFLNGNPDLRIIGIGVRLDKSDIDLSALRPWTKHLKRLTITRTHYKDRAVRDFSFLSECHNLEYFNTDIVAEVLPYINGSTKLTNLVFVGSEEEKFKPDLPNLELLTVYYGPEVTLNLKGCPSLIRLNIGQSRFTSIKLNSNNDLRRLTINNLNNIDLSFLYKCKNLHRLSITVNEGNLDLDSLSGAEHLHILSLEGINNIKGDFTLFQSLKYLKIIGMDNVPVLPPMPSSLKYLRLKMSNENVHEFNMESLSSCVNLEKLYIFNIAGSINVNDIVHCKSLRHLFFHSGEIINSRKLDKLPLLTTLILILISYSTNNESINAKLAKCPLLKSVTLRIRPLRNVDCIQDCKNLEFLDITSDDVVLLRAIPSCPKLKIIILFSMEVRDHTIFLGLNNLRELYIFNNKIKPQDNKKLEDKLIPWNSYYINPLRTNNEALFAVKIDDDVMDQPE